MTAAGWEWEGGNGRRVAWRTGDGRDGWRQSCRERSRVEIGSPPVKNRERPSGLGVGLGLGPRGMARTDDADRDAAVSRADVGFPVLPLCSLLAGGCCWLHRAQHSTSASDKP
ncbi:unnamed protein product [Linum trigynum]|uniref:Uncharacterized protein n=1 Tax=Linum trigynum TaxID=586398 RepID=A0AAV2GKG7_9ROSI